MSGRIRDRIDYRLFAYSSFCILVAILIGSSLYGTPSSSRVMEALMPFGVGQEYRVMAEGMVE